MIRNFLLLLCLIAGLAIIMYHEKIIEWYDHNVGPQDPRPTVAVLESVEGEANYKLPKSLRYKNVYQGLEFKDQDTLTTGPNSSVTIKFNSGYKLKVEPNSLMVIEEPKTDASGSIIVTFLRGNYEVIEKGTTKVPLVIAKEDTLQNAAGRKPPPKPIQITLKPTPTPAPTFIPTPPPIKAEVIEEKKIQIVKATPKPTATPPPREKRETLSDEDIITVIKGQKAFFRRCWEHHLKLNPNAKGRINMSFTIEPDGKVSEAHVLKSTIQDLKLQQCTQDVIQRCKFKKFKGDPIIMSFPINFD